MGVHRNTVPHTPKFLPAAVSLLRNHERRLRSNLAIFSFGMSACLDAPIGVTYVMGGKVTCKDIADAHGMEYAALAVSGESRL